ncbi:MAG TPA: D-alanine--D-alanine ligase family protein [Actinomycetes bacterium]|jgi:D-alanine-D-alanine ligase|nr:D-alanine--D-alanine ligase family protein [Actinomycetes bacterium]
MPRTRLAILYGGRSAEHQVSVVSARSVMEALDPDRFEVVPIAITRAGAWLLPDRSPLELTASDGALPEVEAAGTELAVRPEQGVGGVDVVFPILHGPFGEDGTVQGLFELADLPYVGSGVLASALAMDKAMAKVVLAQAGLPQAPYLVVPERDWRADPDRVAAEVEGRLAYPVFTKPARLGSSIGISKVKIPDGLAAGLADAFAHDTKALVEQGVVARELECGVLGNDAPEASVVGEVVPGHEFYDFEAKYLDESLKLEIPAPVPGAVRDRVRELSLRAFQALDCEGFARVDFFYEEATGRVLLNEVNTIPGFTPKSMFPMLWGASGLSYPDLVARLVDLAVERHAARRR